MFRAQKMHAKRIEWADGSTWGPADVVLDTHWVEIHRPSRPLVLAPREQIRFVETEDDVTEDEGPF